MPIGGWLLRINPVVTPYHPRTMAVLSPYLGRTFPVSRSVGDFDVDSNSRNKCKKNIHKIEATKDTTAKP
ncbi:MAG TPA: hypothetical protein VD794_01455 [Flavisolibacter sp.]|nr:hypothetical protein [Flavisolibacter sp.]